MGASAVEERRVVILTRGVLEFMEELESADTCGCNARCNKKKKTWRCNLGPKSENHRSLIPSQLRTMVLGSGWIYSLDSSALLSHLASPVNTILTLNCCQGCQSVPWVKNQVSLKCIPSEDIFGYHMKIFFLINGNICITTLRYQVGILYHRQRWLKHSLLQLLVVHVTTSLPKSAHSQVGLHLFSQGKSKRKWPSEEVWIGY